MWNIADIIALALVLLGTLAGFKRRLSGELANTAAVCASFVAALFARRPLGDFLHAHSRMSEAGARIAAVIVAIVLALLLMALVRLLLRSIMRVAFEEPFDKTAGAVAGFVKTILFVAIVFLIANMIPGQDGPHRVLGEASFLGRIARRLTPDLQEKIREVAAGERNESDE